MESLFQYVEMSKSSEAIMSFRYAIALNNRVAEIVLAMWIYLGGGVGYPISYGLIGEWIPPADRLHPLWRSQIA